MEKLIEQAPYIVALIILVYMFLLAMRDRDRTYLDAQKQRDELFVGSQIQTNKVIEALTNEIREISQQSIQHDARVVNELNKITKSKKR